MTGPHATAADIRGLIAEGHTNAEIVRRLGIHRSSVSRIRGRLGIPNPPRQALTLEQAWQARTRDTGDGHLEWAGPIGYGRTAVINHAGQQYTAGRVAYRLRYGREPEGTVKPECGRHGCLAPDHVEDAPGRARIRSIHRTVLLQLPAPPDRCSNGHDQNEYGRFNSDGHAYCAECQRHAKARQRARAGAAE